ncbi:MAG TPA: DUF4352 domain-containing protein [Candidatus Sulfopaludibacter sp.]|jgi:hypothetical protein|nr:DUF4352 domain-containing protein [Candidatus Sulfopaludibacter sp.]
MRQVSVLFALVFAILFSGCSTPSSAPRTFSVGEKVTVGTIIYTVFETQWLTHVGAPPDEKVPQNRFFLVRIGAVNSGGSEVMLPTLTVEDDKGQSYAELTSDIGAAQWLGALRPIHPADSLSGNVVFDCPPAHYKLHITDDQSGRSALIDLPLTFNSEATDVPEAIPPPKK